MLEEYKYISSNSTYVHIDKSKIDEFLKDFKNIKYIHWSKEINLDISEKEWILLVFIIESMNFCFWRKPKWKVEYNNEIYTGSNALLYKIIQEVETNRDFLKIENLKNMTLDDFKEILKGIDYECPLIEERYKNFREVINYISSHNFFEEILNIKNNNQLLEYIINNFPNFNDKSLYKGKIIHFYKRANLLVNDLYWVSNRIKNNIHDVNNLYGCADYGIPRTFRDYEIMIYSDKLKELIDNEIELLHDSDMEIEIRGNMLYIIELIKERLREKNIIINSIELDSLIWQMGKHLSNRSNSHHTVTTYY